MRHHYLPFIIVIIAAILEDDFWYDFILIYFFVPTSKIKLSALCFLYLNQRICQEEEEKEFAQEKRNPEAFNMIQIIYKRCKVAHFMRT